MNLDYMLERRYGGVAVRASVAMERNGRRSNGERGLGVPAVPVHVLKQKNDVGGTEMLLLVRSVTENS